MANIFPHLSGGGQVEVESGPRSFVGIMQTSDILGNPDKKIGNVDVLSNGGRLQAGCYTNENNIFECEKAWAILWRPLFNNLPFSVGSAVKCSFDRGVQLFSNSLNNAYKSR